MLTSRRCSFAQYVTCFRLGWASNIKFHESRSSRKNADRGEIMETDTKLCVGVFQDFRIYSDIQSLGKGFRKLKETSRLW